MTEILKPSPCHLITISQKNNYDMTTYPVTLTPNVVFKPMCESHQGVLVL